MIALRTQFLSTVVPVACCCCSSSRKTVAIFCLHVRFLSEQGPKWFTIGGRAAAVSIHSSRRKELSISTKIQTSFIVHQLHFFPLAFSSTFDFEKFTMNPQLALFSFSFTFTFDFHNNCGCFGLCMSRHRTKKFTFQASPRDWCLSSSIQIAAMVPLSATLNRNCLALS